MNGNNWYFGNSNQAILFNKSDNEAVIEEIQATPYGRGGGVVVSDEFDGNTLFYSDGVNIYDATHSLLPNGAGLSGDSTINQSAVAAPISGGLNLAWFIFTNSGNQGVNEIQYTRVNIELPGNANQANQPDLGDVGPEKNASTGLTNPSPGMLMIRKRNRVHSWLLSQDQSSGVYRVLEVLGGALGTTQTFDLSAEAPQIIAENFAGIVVNDSTVRIAVSPKNANRNIQILRLNTETGALTFDQQITNTGNTDTPTAIYDTEWSADSTKLYISRHGAAGLTGNLFQFDFLDTLGNVNSLLPNPVFRSFGLKLAPDGQIYHLYQETNTSPISIGAITQPDFAFDSLIYEPAPFTDAAFNGFQFPEQAEPATNMFQQAVFTYVDSCLTLTTKFTPNVDPPPSFYFWDFGDGNTSFDHSPIHEYEAAGMFSVTMTVFHNGALETFTNTVNILDTQLEVDLGADTVICRGEILLLDAGTGGLSYAWNTGESTQTIEVDSAGTYWVAVEAPNPNNPGVSSGCLLFDDIAVEVYGETETISNQWYFGEMAGIDFNETPPVPLVDENQMNSPEAAATISDINGDLLFYTNGASVYHKDHGRMVGGFDIGGDSTSAQGALIVPVPMDATTFYIFTTDPAWGDQTFDVRYSVVDLKEDSARGAVVLKDRPLFYKATERMTASSPGGNLTWLVTHEFGNNTFRSYPITEDGIGSATFSTAGTILSPATEGNSRNSMKLSADVSRLAMTIAGDENFVEIYNYADTTGEVSDPVLINIEEPAPAEIYGVEFSSNTQKLYVTTRGGGSSKLIQYDLDTLQADSIAMSKFVIAEDAQEFGQLQTGPNGVIYMAINGSPDLGTINNPNGDDDQAGFVINGFNLGGRISTLGLPNFVQNTSQPPQSPSIGASDGCIGQESQFTGNGTSSIDEYFWTFGDGGSSMEQSPVYTYNAIGSYTVSLNITNRCGLDTTLTQQISINPLPTRPTTPGATAICQDTLVLEALPADDPAFAYNWSTGDTTRQITVSQPGIFDIFITDRATGCTSDTVQVLVADGRPIIDLGPPRTVCTGEQIADLDAENPGASYAWTLNGNNLANVGRFQTVNTNATGDFEYAVSVVDPITGCIGRDTLQLTVNGPPDITLNATATTNCGQLDGQIDIVFNETGNFDYQIISGGTSVASGNIDGPVTVPVTGIGAGSYSVTTTNTVSNCSGTTSTNIADSNTNFQVALTAVPDCGTNGAIDMTVTNTVDPLVAIAYNYTLSFSDGTVVSTGSDIATTLRFNPPPLDTGTYNVVVVRTDVTPNCTETAQVNLGENPPANILIDPVYNFCGGSGTINPSVDGGGTLTWTLPDGSVTAGNPLNVTQSGTYSVTSSAAGFCPQTETTEVIISQDPVVSIDVSGDQCDGQLTLTAVTDNQNGNNSFVWGSNDANNGSNSPVINVFESGTYTVTARNQNTGCQTNTSVDVNVEPLLELFITSEPDCDDNSQIFLIAESNITADVTFEWIGPSGELLPDTTAIIAVNQSGLYTARVIRTNSLCDASANFDALLEPILEEDLILPSRAVICPEDPATSTASLDAGTFSTFEWRLVPDETILATTQTYDITVPGRYEVTISNGLTCIKDFVEVVEDCTPRIFAPTAFTPNGDGLNDSFAIFNNPFVSDFNIFIYNRWGELVFTANNLDFRWDGLFRGELAPIGTYAFVAKFRSSIDPDVGEIEQHGSVTLIR